MTFVTRLRLTSGDQTVLDRVVNDIKSSAQRKGAKLKGPHSHPPLELSVPQYKCSPPGDDQGDESDRDRAEDRDREDLFGNWGYTVYQREIEIVGHEEFARSIAGREFPSSVHVEVEVDRQTGIGR